MTRKTFTEFGLHFASYDVMLRKTLSIKHLHAANALSYDGHGREVPLQ
jgi:hypothetical protein